MFQNNCTEAHSFQYTYIMMMEWNPYKFYCCGVRSNVKKSVAKIVGLWAFCLKDFWTIFQHLSSVAVMWRAQLQTKTQKTSMMKNSVCSCVLHSMHIMCGDAMSHPRSIIVVWNNNYHMIWIDDTNLHSLIACYIQAILVLTLKTNTELTPTRSFDDTCCMLCAKAFVFKPKIIEMLLSLIMNLHNTMLNLLHQISCSYKPFWEG